MAEIQVKIKGEDPDLVRKLKELQNGEVKLIKGFVLYEPKLYEGFDLMEKVQNGKKYEPDKDWGFVIPEIIREKEKVFCISACEGGGGSTSTGCAAVICGLSGKALKPYYVPRGGNLCNKTHAYFSVPEACVEITAWKKSGNIRIDKWYLEYDSCFVILHCQELWKGQYDQLPNIFSQYEAAAKVAIEKAWCYHCRSPHYILVEAEK